MTMDRQKKNGIPSEDGEMLIRLTNLLESSCLQKLSASSFPSSSSSSARFAVTDSSSVRNSCGRSTSSTINENASDMLQYSTSRNQQKKGKNKSVATSECSDDRDYLPTSSAISFKSWQSKVGTSSTVASNVNKANRAKGIVGTMNGSRSRVADGFQQSEQQDSKRWSNFLDRVNEKEKEKRRGIKVEKRRIDLLEGAECFFSPNLTTKSLKMAASFDQLKDRIPHMLSAREDFLEQQRQILIKKEADECTFSPLRQSADRGDFYLQNPSSSSCSLSLPPSDYQPYLIERMRKDDILRSQLAERDAHELTFQPRTNAAKYLSASVARRLKAARATTDRERETANMGRGRDQGQGQSRVSEQGSVGGSKDQRAIGHHQGGTKKTKGTGKGARVEGVGSVTSSDGAEIRQRERGRTKEAQEVIGSHSDSDDESESDGSRGDSVDHTALGVSAHSLRQSQRQKQSPTDANGRPNSINSRGNSGDGGVNDRNSVSGIDGDGDSANINASSNRCSSSNRNSNSCNADAPHSDSCSEPEGDPPLSMTMTPIARATYDTIRLRDLPDEEEEGEEEEDDSSHLKGQGQGGGSVTHSCHERLYQLGLEHWTRLDEVHQRACTRDSLPPPPSPLLTPSRQVTPWDRLHRDGQRKARSSAYKESDSSTFAQRLRTPSSRANIMVSAPKPSSKSRPHSSVSSFHAINKRGGHAHIHRARGSSRPATGAGTGVKALARGGNSSRSAKGTAAGRRVMRNKEEEESGGSDDDVHDDDAAESNADYVAVVDCNRMEGTAEGDGEYRQQLRRLWCDLLDC